MTELGVVLKVKDNFAQVRVGRNSACASCGKCGMTEKQKHVDFFASNEIGAADGDTVELDIPEGNSAKFALIAYFIPLAPALALLFLALGLKWAEWLAILLFFAGLALGFAVLAIIDKARKHKWMETPVITRIIHKNPTATAENIAATVDDKQEIKTEGENNHE
ncbi:MAG: SoxR reducing system RseC family protein [Clostridiales bacterium]|nr:SoxR reducing system RseC family protein [Clostridiales bacterium]